MVSINTFPLMFLEKDYKPGELIKVQIQFEWSNTPLNSRDFSVLSYASKPVPVQDASGGLNEVHMDEPSNFKIDKDTLPLYPKSLIDTFVNTNSVAEAIQVIKDNIWVLWTWFNPY